ncbi:Suppressor of cytokine signaling 2 [Sciurus carolinensis]|uniref:Suppressor of cytokine signaling 2 n=1 Tax=Sciurus carolinensis TaxID=30640 RepID=A0AA41SS42_SCICA|nr:Suppressor of cytokine signaling 2 [Sciurus carolinensis]
MMKFKPNQTRTYDREGFKKRAACLCFRSEQEDEVLLVSSSRYPDQWIVPGGGMEPEEEPGGAAVREVYEEAGVKGKLGRLLGIFEQNQDRKHRTYVYVLTVTEILEDWEDSVNIGWYWGSMTVNEAKEKLKEAPEGTFLIRDSSHSDYLLTISVKTSAGPTNLRIEYQDGKFRLDSIICVKSKLKQFDSVVHLIDYYVQMCKDKRSGPEAPRNGTVHLYLTKPLYTSAPSLQHLCRLTINKCTGTIWGLPLPTRLKDYLEEYKFQV